MCAYISANYIAPNGQKCVFQNITETLIPCSEHASVAASFVNNYRGRAASRAGQSAWLVSLGPAPDRGGR